MVHDVRALLYRTARNLVIDQHRRALHRQHDHLDALDEAEQPLAPRHLQPEEVLAYEQQARALVRVIEALPPRCREAFVLNRFEGWSHQQVADHMGISPDGKHIAVSATSDGHFFVIDTATGKQVAKVPTGAFPHQNDYSPDGKYIYNSSLGIIPLPYALNALKGRKQMTVVDAQTFKVVNKWTLPYGIRPNVITRDGKITYLQMSYLNGYAKVDMATGKVLNKVEIPMSAYAKANFKTKDDFPLNSAFHGMAINGAESKLCMAGTIDNYIVVASVPSMTTDRIIPSGSKPYWASTSSDGKRCYVSNSESNDLSVVDFESATEVARIKVGQYPQRSRLANVPPAILDNLKH